MPAQQLGEQSEEGAEGGEATFAGVSAQAFGEVGADGLAQLAAVVPAAGAGRVRPGSGRSYCRSWSSLRQNASDAGAYAAPAWSRTWSA